jgi:hypothetical protein
LASDLTGSTNEPIDPTSPEDYGIEKFFDLLPVHHKFSDTLSQLSNGQYVQGHVEHEVYCPTSIRNAYRYRTLVFPSKVFCNGGYGGFPVVTYPVPKDCTVAFIAIHDWTLESEFILANPTAICQQIQDHKYLHIEKYVQSIFKSFVVAFTALQEKCSGKVYIRIAPMAMGPSIGKHLFNITKQWYMKAVCLALLNSVNASWVDTIDLIDFHGIFTEIPKIPNVNIKCSRNDILDIPKSDHYAILAPIDSFSKPWLREPLVLFDNLASCIINNTSISKENWNYEFKKI